MIKWHLEKGKTSRLSSKTSCVHQFRCKCYQPGLIFIFSSPDMVVFYLLILSVISVTWVPLSDLHVSHISLYYTVLRGSFVVPSTTSYIILSTCFTFLIGVLRLACNLSSVKLTVRTSQ